MDDFLKYLKEANQVPDIKSIPNYEKYLSPEVFENFLAHKIDDVLFIIDFRIPKFIYLSPNTSYVHGYEKEEILALGPVNFYNLIHPDDHEIIMKEVFTDITKFISQNSELDSTSLNISYNYRLKQKNDTYRFLMNSFSYMILGEGFFPLVIIGTVSDISDLYTRKGLFCQIKYKNSKGANEKLFERFYPFREMNETSNLTKKELEVLKYVHDGYSSKEIAHKTNRSTETINVHRKNIIKKLEVNSITDAIVLAKDNNWF